MSCWSNVRHQHGHAPFAGRWVLVSMHVTLRRLSQALRISKWRGGERKRHPAQYGRPEQSAAIAKREDTQSFICTLRLSQGSCWWTSYMWRCQGAKCCYLRRNRAWQETTVWACLMRLLLMSFVAILALKCNCDFEIDMRTKTLTHNHQAQHNKDCKAKIRLNRT